MYNEKEIDVTTHNTDIQNILKDPSAVYDSPQAVLGDDHLSSQDKKEVLRVWAEDAKALLRAENENMSPDHIACGASEKLALIFEAQESLKE